MNEEVSNQDKIINVLLVEDSVADVKITLRAFKKASMNMNVLVTNNGMEALEYFNNEGRFTDPVKFPKPDIVLMDINMPKLNGFETLEKIKQDARFKNIPIIMLTSSKNESDIANSYSGGAAGFIQKPVNYDDFCTVVKKFDDYWSSIIKLPQ